MNKQLISLRRLSKHFDYNRTHMADALDVNLTTISMWFNRGRISKQGAVKAEKATKGAITAAQLRPDVIDFTEE